MQVYSFRIYYVDIYFCVWVGGLRSVRTDLFSGPVRLVFVRRNPEATSRVLCLTGAQVSFGRAPSPSVAFRVTPTGVPLLVDSVILELPQASGSLKRSFSGREWRKGQMREGESSLYSVVPSKTGDN